MRTRKKTNKTGKICLCTIIHIMTEKSRREKDPFAHASFRALKRGKTNEINNSSRQNRKAMNLGCFEMHTSCSLWTGSRFFLGKKIARKGLFTGYLSPHFPSLSLLFFSPKLEPRACSQASPQAFSLFPLPSSPLDQRPVHRLSIAILA